MEGITATIINFNEQTGEAFATIGGTIAMIDPFVTGLWDWSERAKYIKNTYHFKGFWYGNSESKCFLPDTVEPADRRTEFTA